MRKHFLIKGTQPQVSIVRTECSVRVCSTSHTYLSSHPSGICAVKTSTTAPCKAAKEAPSGLQVKKHSVLMAVIMHTARFMRQSTHNLYPQSIYVDHDSKTVNARHQGFTRTKICQRKRMVSRQRCCLTLRPSQSLVMVDNLPHGLLQENTFLIQRIFLNLLPSLPLFPCRYCADILCGCLLFMACAQLKGP